MKVLALIFLFATIAMVSAQYHYYGSPYVSYSGYPAATYTSAYAHAPAYTNAYYGGGYYPGYAGYSPFFKK